jgi:hypothetical protein
LKNSRHGIDGLAQLAPAANKQRQDELLDAQARFGHELPQRRRLPQPARTIRGKLSNRLQTHEPILGSKRKVQSGKVAMNVARRRAEATLWRAREGGKDAKKMSRGSRINLQPISFCGFGFTHVKKVCPEKVVWETAREIAQPRQGRHLCRNAPQIIQSSVRSGIFRYRP